MKTIRSISEMQQAAEALRREGKRIGVVPTMGYLHRGHASLIETIRRQADIVITTIFVNPTQFAPTEDLSKYPRDLERDSRIALEAGCDILFVPDAADIYPKEYRTYVTVEEITGVLEGKSRPTHFRGVTTIVAKLFNITKPDVAIFGQKDAQQAVVIRQMAKDLNFDLKIVVAPIIREPDGLALSSRNVYLTERERTESTVLYRSLELAQRLIGEGEHRPNVIIGQMEKLICSVPSSQIDYIAITDPRSLQPAADLQKAGEVLISLAVRIGTTRLIDNILVDVPTAPPTERNAYGK